MPSSGLQHTGINKLSLAAIRVLALTAAGIAGYLTWVTLTHGTVAACGDQSSHLACDDVLRSAWSRVVGVPVSLLGFVVYVAILVTSRWIVSKPSQPFREWTRLCCLTLIALAFGAATWFLFLQLFVIRHICPFCLIIHLCGIMIAVISFSAIAMEEARRRRPSYLETIQQLTVGTVSAAATMPESYRQLRPKKHWSVLVAVCALLVLVVLQVFFSTKTYEVLEADELLADASVESLMHSTQGTALNQDSMDRPSADVPSVGNRETIPHPDVGPRQRETADTARQASPTRKMKFLNGRLEIDVYEHGLLGSPEADLVVIELVDYTCPDCRQVHQYLNTVREQLGDRFAVIVFPVPLETTCNRYIRSTQSKHVGACKYAKLALAVFSVAPDKFGQFHDWLMDSEEAPPFEDVVRYAEGLVGPDHDLERAEASRLQDYVRLFNVANIHRLPAMIIGDKVMIGVPKSANDVLQMMDRRLR